MFSFAYSKAFCLAIYMISQLVLLNITIIHEITTCLTSKRKSQYQFSDAFSLFSLTKVAHNGENSLENVGFFQAAILRTNLV